jgi:hypothetical protein
MQGTLSQRISAIRLPARSLAAIAGVHVETVYRMMRNRNKRGAFHQNHQAVERAVLAEEIRLRDYLCAIHGPPQGEG